jgi:hypothetical protein
MRNSFFCLVWVHAVSFCLTSLTLWFIVNPLLERVIQIFDENKDNEIQFTEFIRALAIFSTKGAKEEKLKCTSLLPFDFNFPYVPFVSLATSK